MAEKTDLFAWVSKDEERLAEQGGEWQVIVDNHHQFWRNFNDDFLAAELAITRALEAARATNEIKWELYLRHWRMQLWFRQSQVRRALPEAVDLLSLATDRRVQDVPQRICAYHDIIDCYAVMDPVGYHQEIVENSQEILSQLPQKYDCATCARTHLLCTMSVTGNAQQAEYWLNQIQANEPSLRPGLLLDFGDASMALGKWHEAREYYKQALSLAREREDFDRYVKATLGSLYVSLKVGDMRDVHSTLRKTRQLIKDNDNNTNLAKFLEISAAAMVVTNEIPDALDYLEQAARLYYSFGLYRDAAQCALQAVEVAIANSLAPKEAVSQLAARAVGELPPASRDLYDRLAHLGLQPVAPMPNDHTQEIDDTEEQSRAELRARQDILQTQIKQKNTMDVCVTLHTIARWYALHQQWRSALDYLLMGAMLERLLLLSTRDRSNNLNLLRSAQKHLPDGALQSALDVLVQGPPSLIAPLLTGLSTTKWAWTVRALRADIAEEPVVEPEPENKDPEGNFNDWLQHVASMTALLIRFHEHVEAQELQTWVTALQETLQQIETANQAAQDESTTIICSMVRGLIALAQGENSEQVKAQVLPPYDQLITQLAEVAQDPVWFHPGSTPIDYLVEMVSQKAVTALTRYDEYRSGRLLNLALRYKLMAIDLRPEEPLQPIAHFLDALRALMLAGGETLPPLAEPLEEPFATVLKAIYAAGNATAISKQD